MLSCKLYVIAPITMNEIFNLYLFEGRQLTDRSAKLPNDEFEY